MGLNPISAYPVYNYATPHCIKNADNTVFNKFKSDVNNLDLKAVKTALNILSPVPTLRRINSLPDEFEKGNYSRVAGIAGLAVANIPRDGTELLNGIKEGKNIFKNGLNAVKYEGQHKFHFFKGTFLEWLPEKFKWLDKIDKSLYETKFGKFLTNKFNIKPITNSNNLMDDLYNTASSNMAGGYKFSGNYSQKLAGRTLLRMSPLGLGISFLFEIPAIIKSAQKEDNILDKTKSIANQLCKSAGRVGAVNTAIAIGGAILVPYGTIASLVGMAVGSYVGLKAADFTDKQADKFVC